MQIERRPGAADVLRLLADCDLPTADLTDKQLSDFFGCYEAQTLQGIVGFERYGTVALLRSLAVNKNARNKGCGRALVACAEQAALTGGAQTLYLLTTTAEHFFAALNYQRCNRTQAPLPIQQTQQFAALCPANSVLMMKRLT